MPSLYHLEQSLNHLSDCTGHSAQLIILKPKFYNITPFFSYNFSQVSISFYIQITYIYSTYILKCKTTLTNFINVNFRNKLGYIGNLNNIQNNSHRTIKFFRRSSLVSHQIKQQTNDFIRFYMSLNFQLGLKNMGKI